jgi:hypothetical protein
MINATAIAPLNHAIAVSLGKPNSFNSNHLAISILRNKKDADVSRKSLQPKTQLNTVIARTQTTMCLLMTWSNQR